MKAKFKIRDEVLVHTRSSKGVVGTITDKLADEDGNWYYQVRVLEDDWVVEEKDLTRYDPVKYSLNCDYYTKEFTSVDALIEDIVISGMDPNYDITRNGKPTGEIAITLIQF